MLGADAILILALNTFNEARSESDTGQRAVAEVVINRATSGCYPRTIKGVVYQRRQFSWVHQSGQAKSALAASLREPNAWSRAVINSQLASTTPSITKGANMYHAVGVKPNWISKAHFIKRIGNHLFYKLPCN